MAISSGKILENRFVSSLLVFVGGGLIGPFIRWVAWPPSSGGSLEKLIYDLVFLLWPAQMLAVAEVSIGKIAALLLAIAGNILLFTLAGMLVVVTVRKTRTILVAYALLGTGIILLALWGAGFDYRFLNVWALLIALCFYALLVRFASIAWIRRTVA